jgi:SAM-dependent methyltransferase
MHERDPRIDFFDRLAPEWDNEHERLEETLRRLEALRPSLGLRAGQELLEVGCGTGQITDWLVRQVRPGRVTAIDFSDAMLAKARTRALRNLACALRPGGELLVLHMAGWREINAMHDRCEPTVHGDYLPDPPAWETLLSRTGLEVVEWLDRDDLFLLRTKRGNVR